MRFFCYTPDGFERYDSAEAAKTAAEAGLELWTDGEFVEGYESICWGEVRGEVRVDVVHVHGEECKGENGCPEGHLGVGEWAYIGDASLVDVPTTPDPEAERLRAELASLQTKVREIVANFRRESDLCRQPETYNLSRSDAFEDAADRVIDILGDEPAGERVGGEE